MISLRVLLTFYFSDRVDRNVMGAVNLANVRISWSGPTGPTAPGAPDVRGVSDHSHRGFPLQAGRDDLAGRSLQSSALH